MFNWFKSKISLKSTNTIASSSSHKDGVKIGSEIIVPDNFEGIIFNNEKYFFTLQSGKHKLENPTFSNLINTQQMKKNKIKKVKFMCHYVNKSNQKLEFKYKKNKYCIDFKIDDSLKFLSLLLLHTYKFDNEYTQSLLIDIFKELLLYNGLDCSKIQLNALTRYGIVINNLSLSNKSSSMFNKNCINNDKNEENLVNSSDNLKENPTNKLTIEKSSNTGNYQNKSKDKIENMCPHCKNITKFQTSYCLKCGYKLK